MYNPLIVNHIAVIANVPDEKKRLEFEALSNGSSFYIDDTFGYVPPEENFMCLNRAEVLSGAAPLLPTVSAIEPDYNNESMTSLYGKHRIRDNFEALRASNFYFGLESERASHAKETESKDN